MSFFVRDGNNRTHTITLQPALTVRQVKEELGKKEGLNADEQALSFGGKYLPDDALVADHVGAGSTLSMTFRLKGGNVDA